MKSVWLLSIVVAVVLISSSLATASTSGVNCKFTDSASGVTWDLSGLTKATGDYKGSDGSYDYKMNVCAPSNAGSGCTDKHYSACQFNTFGGTFVASLGSFDIAPTWSLISLPPNPPEPYTNGLMYTMTNGDICWITGKQMVRTVITVLRCSPDPTDQMTVTEDPNTCTFTMTLKTPLACPGGGGGTTITSCNYTDPASKLAWDLSDLKRPYLAGDYIGSYGSYNYSMNICAKSTAPGPCSDAKHSVCQYNYRGQYMAGLGGFDRTPNGNWQLIAKDPTVGIQQVYRNGEACGEHPRTTIVQFYCDPHGTRDFKLNVDTDQCIYTFTFRLPEGCPAR